MVQYDIYSFCCREWTNAPGHCDNRSPERYAESHRCEGLGDIYSLRAGSGEVDATNIHFSWSWRNDWPPATRDEYERFQGSVLSRQSRRLADKRYVLRLPDSSGRLGAKVSTFTFMMLKNQEEKILSLTEKKFRDKVEKRTLSIS